MNRQFINREQNFALISRCVNIHSEDRDLQKWKNANEFELILPENMINVHSIRLTHVSLPINDTNFDARFQNTKFWLKVDGVSEEIVLDNAYYNDQTIFIRELQKQLNKHTRSNGKFVVYVDDVTNKIVIAHVSKVFFIEGDKEVSYTQCHGTPAFERDIMWGLLYNLGFNKVEYATTLTTLNQVLHQNLGDPGNVQTNIIVADKPLLLSTNTDIYMEIDKYNSMNEFLPHTKNHSQAGYAGRTSAAFAKLPIYNVNGGFLTLNVNALTANGTFYERPVERIQKIRVKFRYHDGTLVNFGRAPLSFTLQFNQLIDKQSYQMNVVQPLV